MNHQARLIRSAARLLPTTRVRGILLLLLLLVPTAAAATGAARPARPTAHAPVKLWTRCSPHVTIGGFEAGPIEVLHLTCKEAADAIRHGHVLLTPGGPIFTTGGYACHSTNILPRYDPSPIELPATETCISGKHRHLSFILDHAS
jgi:hypothetical protein